MRVNSKSSLLFIRRTSPKVRGKDQPRAQRAKKRSDFRPLGSGLVVCGGLSRGLPPLSCLFAPLTQTFKIMERNTNANQSRSGRGNGKFTGNRNDVGFIQSEGHEVSTSDSLFSNTSTIEFVPIRETDAYKNAYKLFSSIDDNKWLMRLEAIADSVPYYEPTSWLGEFFNSDKYMNKNKEAVSIGVQQINALVAEFQEFRNSLPETQAQQFSDANLNPLTQNYSGSNINPQTTTTSAGVPDVTPLSEIIGSLVSLATSASGGLMSFITTGVGVFKSFQDLKIQERNQILDIASKGFTPSSKDVLSSNRQFLQDRLFPSSFARLNSRSFHKQALERDIEGSLTSDLYSQLFTADDVSEAFKDLSQLNYEIFMNDYRRQNSSLKKDIVENEFKSDVTSQISPALESEKVNTANQSAIESSKTLSEKSKSDRSIEKTFNGILQKWIHKAQNGSFVHQYLIMNLRTSGNTGALDALNSGISIAKSLHSSK